MITLITSDNLNSIKSPTLRKDAESYVKMYADFMNNFKDMGISISDTDYSEERKELIDELLALGVKPLNNGRGFLWGKNLSGACEDCVKGERSRTFIITLKCNRDCFFCANKNQFDYEEGRRRVNDIIAEFNRDGGRTNKFTSVAVTGGEPLLYLDKCLDFIRHVKKRDKNTAVRIYTNGDLADEETLCKLSKAGLDEIRFGLKLEEEAGLERSLAHLALAVNYLPRAMVEMPMETGKLAKMKELADIFQNIGIFAVNILEFLFPWVHVREFKKEEYKVAKRPYRVLYDYTYAGGVPIDGSDIEALLLMRYIAEKGYGYGAYYCSLENKLTAQIWQQNRRVKLSKIEHLSENDFFIKTARVYDEDAARVRDILAKEGVRDFNYNAPNKVIDFALSNISLLKGMDMEIGISYMVSDWQDDKRCLREIAIHKTDTENFTPNDM